MTETAWSHLPNATHIDAVVAAARVAARGAAQGAAWDAAQDAARDAARRAAQGAAQGAARGAAWGAVSALVAWDECGVYMSRDVSAEFMRHLLEVNPDLHAVRLLLPYKTYLEATQ